MIYTDFESGLYKTDTNKPDPTNSFCVKTHLHKPDEFTIYLVSQVNDRVFKLIYY